MLFQKNEIFSLNNFEGPLEFLLYLIQKDEINIYDVSLRELTQQFLSKLTQWQEKRVDLGAEFIASAAYLVWLKSKTLLPVYEETEEEPISEELEEDPNFDVIHHLLDYCRFKDATKELLKRQEQQSSCFFRGAIDTPEWKKPLGIDHISLDELSVLFKDMMSRTAHIKPKIQEENWRVSDKIRFLRVLLKEKSYINIETLFLPEKSKLEWIVIFLAILELMKIGEAGVGRETMTESIVVFAKKEEF